MTYDEIKKDLSHIKEEWEICKGCEHFVDNGDTVTCSAFLPVKFTAIGSRTWKKDEPARPLPNCKHKIEFLVLHNQQNKFCKRDFEKCKLCANFRNFSGHENLLEIGQIPHKNGELYSCLCDPDNFYLTAFDKESFINFGFAGHCKFKKEEKSENQNSEN